MRIFVAGATGVVGRRLVPRLTEAGHEVTGMARRGGAGILAVDALDADAVRAAGLKYEGVGRGGDRELAEPAAVAGPDAQPASLGAGPG